MLSWVLSGDAGYRLTWPSFCPPSPDLRRGEKQEMLGFMFLSPGHNHDIITESISPGLSHAMSNPEIQSCLNDQLEQINCMDHVVTQSNRIGYRKRNSKQSHQTLELIHQKTFDPSDQLPSRNKVRQLKIGSVSSTQIFASQGSEYHPDSRGGNISVIECKKQNKLIQNCNISNCTGK